MARDNVCVLEGGWGGIQGVEKERNELAFSVSNDLFTNSSAEQNDRKMILVTY